MPRLVNRGVGRKQHTIIERIDKYMAQSVVFISYSHKDEREKDKLLAHLGILRHAGLIGLWSDDQIGAGVDWEQKIREAMAQAQVAILLISANFLNSDLF